MTWPKVKKLLKEAGLKFRSPKPWQITITRKNYTQETVQSFLTACRNEDLCRWNIVVPEKDTESVTITWDRKKKS